MVSDNFDASSLFPNLDFCHIGYSLDYCWFMNFSSTLLNQLDLKVRLLLVHTNPTAHVLLGRPNIEVFPSVMLSMPVYPSVLTLSN